MLEGTHPGNRALGVFARDLTAADLTECLSINPGRVGDELVGPEYALEIWRRLIRLPTFSATVIEAKPTVAGHQILGFGCSVFVTRSFADAEMASPRPGLNSRVIASIGSGRSVVMSWEEVRSANTEGGLDMVILFGSWWWGLGHDATSEIASIMAMQFLQHHRGYRINRIFSEAVGEEEIQRNRDTHVYRSLATFDGPGAQLRSFDIITREGALGVAASMITPVFFPVEPTLRLRDADQQLLLTALDGSTDEELSNRLALTLPAVKKRWVSIFERVAVARPDLFPHLNGNNGQRGRQKRHHLLAYVREHPEELRPRLKSEGCDSGESQRVLLCARPSEREAPRDQGLHESDAGGRD